MRFKVGAFVLLLLGCFQGSLAQAQVDSSRAGVIGLDHLLNLKVTVASRQEEQIADAPGTVTAYKYHDIQRLGYYTLADLANITAGYSSFESIGEKTFETRGQKADGFDNNKHLVLIDGIPFSHTRANKAFSDYDLSLLFADRVEFLKGPGSTLYGMSAFYGVINVLSRDLSKNGTLIDSRFSLGNYDFKRRAMFNVVHRAKAGTSKLYVSYFAKDATMDYLGDGTQPNALSRYYDQQSSIFIYGSHRLDEGILKGASIGFLYSMKNTGLGDFWMTQQNQNYQFNSILWETLEPYLKYQRKWGRFTLTSYLKGNVSTERAYVGGYQNYFNPGGQDTLLGVNLYNIRVLDEEVYIEGRWDIIRNMRWNSNLIVAANFDSRFSTGYPQSYALQVASGPGLTFTPDPAFYDRSSTFRTYSLSCQYQQRVDVLRGLMITAGWRLDMGRAFSASNGSIVNDYDQFSPRVALVQQVSRKFNLKAMYGKAIRAPLIKEVGLNEESRTQLILEGRPDLAATIPNLTAESIHSVELGLVYKGKTLNATITGFFNQTKDRLSRVPVPGDPSRYMTINDGIIKAKGFETELMWLPVENMKVVLNYAQAVAKDTAGCDVANVPNRKVNGTIYYSLRGKVKFDFALVGRWIDRWNTGLIHPFFNPGNDPSLNNQSLKGYFVSDLNWIWNATEVLRVELQIRNILDKEIRTPSFVQSGMYNVPNPGRSMLLTLGFKF